MRQISTVERQGTITTDNDPFSSVEAYNAETCFYKVKENWVTTKISQSQFSPDTCWRDSLNQWPRWNAKRSIHTIASKYPQKVTPKSRSSFMPWEIRTRVVDTTIEMAQVWVGPSQTRNTPKKLNWYVRGQSENPLRLKSDGMIPLVEAMLSPEQKWALYLGAEMPKDRKRLGFRHRVLMITITSSKAFPSKEDDEDNQIEEGDDTVGPTKAPPAFEEVASHPGWAPGSQSWIGPRTRPTFISGVCRPKKKMHISNS